MLPPFPGEIDLVGLNPPFLPAFDDEDEEEEVAIDSLVFVGTLISIFGKVGGSLSFVFVVFVVAAVVITGAGSRDCGSSSSSTCFFY